MKSSFILIAFPEVCLDQGKPSEEYVDLRITAKYGQVY